MARNSKSVAQLNREIAQALAKPTKRRHHVAKNETMHADDDWDVAMDAILLRDANKAGVLANKIKSEYGDAAKPTIKFNEALHNAPVKVRKDFFRIVGVPMPTYPADAVKFFRKHGGSAQDAGESRAQGKTRSAERLAYAEAESKRRRWRVVWEDDFEEWQGDVERPDYVMNATLYDADGQVLDSMGGIGFEKSPWADPYRRVVEAELADTALPSLKFR